MIYMSVSDDELMKSFTKSLSSPSSNNATDNLATSSSTTALLTYIKQKNGSELNQPTT